MKKNILGIAVLIAIVFTACAQQKKTSATAATTSSTSAASATTSTAAKKASQKAPAITYIRMNRSACFGSCPVYNIEVFENGLVRYTSQMFTEHQGIFEKNIGTAAVSDLFKKFSDNRVDTCSAQYTSYVQDLPGLHYIIKYGSKEQKISNANFGPDYLSRLAREIDAFVTFDESWKKTGEQPKMK